MAALCGRTLRTCLRPALDTDRCCSTHHRNQEVRAHKASSARFALAARTTEEISRQHSLSSSAPTVRHHHTLWLSVMRRLTVLAVLAFDPPTCTICMFRGQGQIMEIVVSLSTVQLCGTVCQLTCVDRTYFLLTFLNIN